MGNDIKCMDESVKFNLLSQIEIEYRGGEEEGVGPGGRKDGEGMVGGAP
jgi:hypothetical protein